MEKTNLTIMKKAQVEARTSLSRTSIYDMAKTGKFPKPVNLGGRRIGWIEAEVEAWIAERIHVSRNAEAA